MGSLLPEVGLPDPLSDARDMGSTPQISCNTWHRYLSAQISVRLLSRSGAVLVWETRLPSGTLVDHLSVLYRMTGVVLLSCVPAVPAVVLALTIKTWVVIALLKIAQVY